MNPREAFVGFALAAFLWALAAAALYVDAYTLPVVRTPVSPGFADWTETLIASVIDGRRIFIPALVACGLLGAVALLLKWRVDLRPAAPLAPILALLAAQPVNVTKFVVVVLPAMAVLGACSLLVRREGREAEKGFYVVLPLLITLLGIFGAAFQWLGQFGLRESIGASQTTGLAVFAAVCLLAAILAFRSIRLTALRVLVLLAGGWFVSTHTFDTNFPIHASESILGGAADHPHVIVVVVDTLRADVLSYASEDAPQTPSLDALAKDSTIFTNAVSASSWTFPAMTTIMTGLAPLQSLSVETEAGKMAAQQSVKRATLAEYLRSAGYATRAIIGNTLVSRPSRVAAGLDRVEAYAGSAFGVLQWSTRPSYSLPGFTTRYMTDEAIDWARSVDEQPSFLWLHYMAPHSPYLPPEEYLEPSEGREFTETEASFHLYRAEVKLVDAEIGRFIAALKEEGLYDSSIIVFTSDHGESFFEHGELLHGTDLYQELLHVPLLIRAPAAGSSHTVSDHVPTQSLTPTILELAGVDESPLPGWAASLVPLLKDREGLYGAPIVGGANMHREPQWSIVLDDLKYIYREESHHEEFFDLAVDPGELSPLAEPPEPQASAAREALQQHLSFAKKTLEEEGVAPGVQGDELTDRLRSLGYIQ